MLPFPLFPFPLFPILLFPILLFADPFLGLLALIAAAFGGFLRVLGASSVLAHATGCP